MENKMATPLGIDFSTVENQVSQCNEQTFGFISEFKEANVARAPLAKSSKQVSTETDKALCEPTAVLWRNKEAGPQYKDQNLQTVTFENLVVYFDQEKFEELLSGGGPMLHARKHRKVSMAKVSEQKLKAESFQHPQPSVWLVRFPANLSLLFQSRCGGQSRKLCMKPQV